MFFRILTVSLAVLMLSGCAETELASHWWKNLGNGDRRTPRVASSGTVQQGSYKVGNPYQAMGQWYTPVENYSYDETGIASWYGDEFHGKRTANGETFNKNALTAAHPTLQMPSLIRVTNLDNGRSAVLRVNDRGPFSRKRLIDVSHHAADVLGFMRQGTAKVRIQVLERESRVLAEAARKGYSPDQQMAMAFQRVPATDGEQVASVDNSVMPPSKVTSQDIDDLNKQLFRKFPVTPTSIYIQVGSFTNPQNAQALKPKLARFGTVNIYQTTVNGRGFSRVRIGPVPSVDAADNLLSRVAAAGYREARTVVD